MQIRLHFFAQLREMVKTSEFVLESVGPLSCKEAVLKVTEQYPQASGLVKTCSVAKNGNFVGQETDLEDGDELAILPPVSGG